MSDPDILIRTRHQRLSNLCFGKWHIPNYFVKKLWPDFTGNDLLKIIAKYKNIKGILASMISQNFKKEFLHQFFNFDFSFNF